jgi:hypothetical protein
LQPSKRKFEYTGGRFTLINLPEAVEAYLNSLFFSEKNLNSIAFIKKVPKKDDMSGDNLYALRINNENFALIDDQGKSMSIEGNIDEKYISDNFFYVEQLFNRAGIIDLATMRYIAMLRERGMMTATL